MFDEWSCLDRPHFDPWRWRGRGVGLGRLAGAAPMTLVLSCVIPDRTQRPHAHGRPPSRVPVARCVVSRGSVPPTPRISSTRPKVIDSMKSRSKKVKETPRSGILRPRGTVVDLWLSGCAFSIPILYLSTLPLLSLGRTTTSDAPARMTDEYTMVSSSARAAQPSRGGARTVR